MLILEISNIFKIKIKDVISLGFYYITKIRLIKKAVFFSLSVFTVIFMLKKVKYIEF